MTVTPITPSSTASTAISKIENPLMLWTMRLGWLVFVVFILWLNGGGIIKSFNRELCAEAANGCTQNYTTYSQEMAARWTALGVDYHIPLYFESLSSVLVYFLFILMGLAIAAIRSDSVIGLLTSAGLVVQYAFDPLIGQIAPVVLLTLLLIFPNSRLQPRWGLITLLGMLPVLLYERFTSVIYILFWMATCFYVYSYRYRKFLNQTEKQQSKWVYYSYGVVGIYFLTANLIVRLLLASIGNDFAIAVFDSVHQLLGNSILLTVPIAFWVSITRYRLFDINIIINRTLVYGAVTIFLLALGLGVIALVSTFFGSQGTLIGVAFGGGLAIGLFRPAQAFIQHQVDRRIYGLRYDLNEIAAARKKPDIKNAGLYTGKTFGKYEALDVIGRGGMGEVYKGFADGETVAIKILPADLAQKPELWKRFERESQTLQALQHPNIVKWRESGVSDAVAYLAMEYVEGEELGAVLKTGRVQDYDTLLDWLKNIAAALDFAHEKGYVHRDLKPSNIMLRRGKDIEVKEAILMDFGVARTLATVTRLTGTGALGTIDYMAPEQILEAKEVDKRADIYALGVIVYELLTGERPFKGSAGQILFAHLQQPAPDPRTIQADIPREIAHAIEKALAKDPNERFQSAGGFVASLQA
jgi:tRNA A-37 threonylcarbamoyl transferase component Bud32